MDQVNHADSRAASDFFNTLLMSVIQLRRYQFRKGVLPDWAVHWRENVRPLREQFGFTVVFAYADYENNQFVWAVRFDGTAEELAVRDQEYHDSPEWAARLGGKNGGMVSATIAIVDEISPLV
ncbi:MAG: hypothetical protein PW786_13095 [Arachidicoccus sp.]|nr:hypothetical protein [Arachidicoccus sp.]